MDSENQGKVAGHAELNPLRHGKQLRFKISALNGLEGWLKPVSSKRVAVLFELLGQQQLVNAGHCQLALV